MVTTNDPQLADRIRLLANHGMRPRYYHQEIGINSRLDAIQAALLNVKVQHLEKWTARRQENAQRYHHLFDTFGLTEHFGLPTWQHDCGHVWNQYTIRIPHGYRDAVRQQLADRKIGTEIYYPVPLHQQACFAYLGYETGSLPETERASKEVLSLPIFPELTADEQLTVVTTLAAIFETAQPAARRAAA